MQAALGVSLQEWSVDLERQVRELEERLETRLEEEVQVRAWYTMCCSPVLALRSRPLGANCLPCWGWA